MKKINLTADSIIYVLCPAFYKTGGTELLHQYVSVAKKSGLNCNIVYPNASKEKNINPSFTKYVSTFFEMDDIVDEKENVVIVPEIYTRFLLRFKKAKKIVWWESVDNYLINVSLKYSFKHFFEKPYFFLKNIIKILLRKNVDLSIKKIKKMADYHFAQSYYAFNYLRKAGVKNSIFKVSDFINEIYTNDYPNYDIKSKENIVCYNPAKGKSFTKKIIKSFKNKNIIFVQLSNMTNEQVFDTLKKSKVYIDFGNHPGKDRFPREAAIMGCCIITNTRGSAKFYEDVVIGASFKFKHSVFRINQIVNKIEECVFGYENIIKEFELYQKSILLEKDSFEKDLLDCYLVR